MKEEKLIREWIEIGVIFYYIAKLYQLFKFMSKEMQQEDCE
jgi:hypothetical protein